MMNGIWIDGAGWFFGVLIAAGVVLLIILLVRLVGGRASRNTSDGQGTQGPSSARQVLDERYARGDLTTEEYQERVRVLGEGT
ncbi:MAG: SHOCT domain-containing protein [Cryobacterium sp.]|nr:SHOCT domain-containing protein [Micrococcales bacterium]MBX3308977.1 SHOCT domain-containing protein [Cryobacterium sp.]